MPRRQTTKVVVPDTTPLVTEKKVTQMAGFTIDMTGVSTSNIVDAGEYKVTLTKVTLKNPAGAQASHRLVFELTINEAEPDNEESVGRKVYTSYTLNKDFFWMLKRDLIALDADPEDVEGKFDVVAVSEALKGHSALASVTIENTNRGEMNRTQLRALEF